MNRPRKLTTGVRRGRRPAGRGKTTAKWANVTGMSAAVAHRTRTTARTTTGSSRLRRMPTSVPHTASVVANAANHRLTERRGLRSQTTTPSAISIKATRNTPTMGVMAASRPQPVHAASARPRMTAEWVGPIAREVTMTRFTRAGRPRPAT